MKFHDPASLPSSKEHLPIGLEAGLPRTDLDVVEKRVESQFPGRPVRSPSLYRLSHLRSIMYLLLRLNCMNKLVNVFPLREELNKFVFQMVSLQTNTDMIPIPSSGGSQITFPNRSTLI
jgi:hypothetical protein